MDTYGFSYPKLTFEIMGNFFCVLFLILYLSTFIKWSTNKMIEKHLEYNKLFRYDSYTSNHYIMKVRKRQENN